jgi:heme/copper-type cytochrome/quinol oxidase subunit 3
MGVARLIKITNRESVRRFPNTYHRFHLLKPSIWPFLASLAILLLVYGMVYWFYSGRFNTVAFGLCELFIVQILWWSDVSLESGEHTPEVGRGLRIGMVLFITSEVMFFFSFFWAFFHVSLVPDFELGGVWPPIGLQQIVIDPWEVPLLNTFLLLGSGVTVTGSHHALSRYFRLSKLLVFISTRELGQFLQLQRVILSFRRDVVILLALLKREAVSRFFVGVELLILTVVLALMFTALQAYEYVESQVRLSDSVYGSTFFVMTGFHGLHVIIGSIFLIVCLIRILSSSFYKESVGFECAIWYWHFVDVVWLFLFISIYVWGNTYIEKVFFNFSELGTIKSADYAVDYQIVFQDPATIAMEGIVDLHHNIMMILLFILTAVTLALYNLISSGVVRKWPGAGFVPFKGYIPRIFRTVLSYFF